METLPLFGKNESRPAKTKLVEVMENRGFALLIGALLGSLAWERQN